MRWLCGAHTTVCIGSAERRLSSQAPPPRSCGAHLVFSSRRLLIPAAAPLVGSVVLPILGAVPDGAIVLFSGLSGTPAEAQQNLSVGVGALAGSTIMLLTIPWCLAIYAGRVDITDGGECSYRRPKLDGLHAMMTATGVQPTASAMKGSAKWMVITSFTYVIIQGSAFMYQASAALTAPPPGFRRVPGGCRGTRHPPPIATPPPISPLVANAPL